MDRSSTKSPALARFVASMCLNLERWRDGDPYDLAALDNLSSHEQREVLQLLAERLAGSGGDWRDVDSLAALGTIHFTKENVMARQNKDPDPTSKKNKSKAPQTDDIVKQKERQKAEGQEVAGRHKNEGQKGHKGRR